MLLPSLPRNLPFHARNVSRFSGFWPWLAAALLILALAPGASAQNVNWTGNTSGNFASDTNWNTGLAPNSTTTAVVDTTNVPGNWPLVPTGNFTVDNLYVGNTSSSSANTSLAIGSSTALDVNLQTVIGWDAGSTGNISVSGASAILRSNSLTVGGSGNGTLTLTNGGFLDTNGGSIAVGALAVGNVVVTGANSTWDAGEPVIVGGQGSANLTVSNGGNFIVGDLTLANSSGSAATLAVTGIDSTVHGYSGNVILGNDGAAHLIVSDGAVVESGNTELGAMAGGSGTVLVTGTNATWSLLEPDSPFIVDHSLMIGDAGTGNLTISNGGSVSSGTVFLGFSAGGAGNVVVTDTASTWDVEFDQVYIGYGGSGNLTVANGALAMAAGSDGDGFSAVLGYLEGAEGTALITGANSTWNVGTINGFGGLGVGLSGNGNLTISNGGTVAITTGEFGDDAGLIVARDATSHSSVTVTGAGSTLLVPVDGFTSIVGYNGTAVLTISDGGLFETHGYDCPCNGVSLYLGFGATGNGSVQVTGTGSTLLVADDGFGLRVGEAGIGSLVVSNGGNASILGTDEDFSMEVGYQLGSQGTVLVTDAGSTLVTGAQGIALGYNGTGSLTVANGGNVTAGDIAVGFGDTGVGNLVVSGANSTLTINGNLTLGTSGQGNLTITNGGIVNSLGFDDTTGIGTVAALNVQSKANITVTNLGVWNIGNLDIGYPTGGFILGSSGNANLTVSNGATVNSIGWDSDGVSLYVGYEASSNSTVLVTGANSHLEVGSFDATYGALMVGRYGNGNLTIANGGVVTVEGGDDPNSIGIYIGYGNTSNSAILVTDPGSTLNLPDGAFALAVGYNGTGLLTIANGGNFYDGGLDCGCDGVALYAGYLAGSNGTIVLTGTGSSLTIPSDGYAFYIGYNGTGNFTVSDGAHASTRGSDDDSVSVRIGRGAGSNGSALVTGAGSQWVIGSDGIFVGDRGNATLTISNGGNVTSGSGALAFNATGNGTVLVTDPGSMWYLKRSTLFVGVAGVGNLTITNGGNVTDEVGYIGGYDFEDEHGTGSVLVTGANSTWTNSKFLSVGDGGTGNLTISNGGVVKSLGDDGLGFGLYVGYNGTGTLLVTDPGSALNVTAKMWVGWIAPGNLTIANGGVVTVNDDIQVDNGSTATITGAGSSWIANGTLSVGVYGNASLTIANGGNLSTTGTGVADTVGSFNGTVLVTGAGSRWNSGADFLTVGDTGLGNLTITNGGRVDSNGLVYAGVYLNGQGSINVANGTLTANSSIYVSYAGPANMTVSDGGNVTTALDGIIGLVSGGVGTVLVTDPGSRWVMANGSLTVGDGGRGNLTIANGGNVTADIGYIASSNLTSGNLIVTGANSTLNILSYASIGYNGTANLTVSSGGVVSITGNDNLSTSAYFGDGTDSETTALVTGAGSKFLAHGSVRVGYFGNASLTIANGGNLTSGADSSIGFVEGGNGQVTVTDSGSIWNVSTLHVGYMGNGTLTISNGGNVSSLDAEFAYVGTTTTGNGTVIVTDTGSAWDIGDYIIAVGDAGHGCITVSNGGMIHTDASYIGNTTTGVGNIVITGANSFWDACSINVGLEGTGFLTITNGGRVLSDEIATIGDFSTANGTVLVTGANSTWDITLSQLVVGTEGVANFTVSNGGNVTSNGASIADGSGTGTALITDAGSVWTITDDFFVGHFGTANLTIANGGVVSAQGVNIGGNMGSAGSIYLNGTSGNRGTLEAANVTAGVGTSTLTFNGGVLRAGANSTSFVSGFGAGNLVANSGGAFIDSNGHNVTIVSALSGTGGLTKQGAGIVRLTAANLYTGPTVINAGALVVDGSLATSGVQASGSTAVLAGNGTIPNATVTGGAMISPGIANTISGGNVSAFSHLTITGNLDWTGNGTTNLWHLNTGNVSVTGFASDASDRVIVQGNLTNTGTTGAIIFDFDHTGFFDGLDPHPYTLMTVGGNTFTDAGFLLSQFQALNVGSGLSGFFQFANSGQSLQFVVVPEPGTWALLAGGAALALALCRRRALSRKQ